MESRCDPSRLDGILTGLVGVRDRATTALLAVIAELLVDEPAPQLRCRDELAERDVAQGALPKATAGWLVEVVESEIVAVTPRLEGVAQGDAVAVALDAIQSTALPAGVTHPAGADSGTRIAERPVTLGGWQQTWSSLGRI